jgi:DNA polymerase-4
MIAHIDLDSFFVAVECARSPALAGRAVVIGGTPRSRGLVAAASREARRAGIRPGMPLEAAALRCPEAVFLDGALDAYLAASAEVDALVRRESAAIEWVSIDELFVALPDSTRESGLDAVERVQQGLRSLGLKAACGVARSKVVARIASRLAHPSGVVHVLDGYEARFLSPLKIEMLPDVDAVVARRLRARGVRRIGHLARLDPAVAAQIAGRAGTALTRQAVGLDTIPLRRAPMPRGPIADRALPHPTADPDAVQSALDARIAELGQQLRSHGAYARTLTVRLRFADGRADSRTARLQEPSALTDVLQASAAELLAQMVRPDRRVHAVGVWCAGLLDASGAPSLFHLR